VLGGVTTLTVRGATRPRPGSSWWPYVSTAEGSETAGEDGGVTLTAVPYFAWGNRDEGAMRVWVPAT